MGKPCNLELSLVSFSDSDHRHHHLKMEKPNYETPQQEQQLQQQQRQQQQQQQLTIFYNGSICVCDVTELQARSILSLASREMKGKLRNTNGSEEASSPSSTLLSQQLHSRPAGLHMKKSLQRFLQKRKHRTQAISPYNLNRPELHTRRSSNSLICRSEEQRRPILFHL